MEALSYMYTILGCGLMALALIKLFFVYKRFSIKKYSPIINQLSKGFLGLTSSRKGILCIIMFFCSIIPMTALCFLGKIDGTAYGICLSAVTTAVVAVFCHTQSKTDQILGTPGLPAPTTTETIIGPDTIAQSISGPATVINTTPVIPNITTQEPNS